VARDAAGGERALAATLIADAATLTQATAARTRLCVLCGGPLRAGQRILRVHGSTIHARCTSSGG
jgi:hypothetical protein